MNADRELLELAAKAADIDLEWDADGVAWRKWPSFKWDPIKDDGDALLLGVSLDLLSSPRFFHERDVLMFTMNTPKLEATRRAIVRAAAEIGKAMP